MAQESQPFKYYYGAELAQELGERIRPIYPAFPAEAFVERVAAQVDELELKARVVVIAEELRHALPDDYGAALDILLAILGPELPAEAGMFNHGYYLMPVAYFVERYGLEHFERSTAALREITRRHTAEYAIRPFLERYQSQTLDLLRRWAEDESAHVRRLVSEGSRPRLPWATRLQAFIVDPGPVLDLLERLKDDPSPYVRKSVANSLNDIAKDHPDLVVATLQGWQAGASAERRWIIRHALRTLIKQGHPAALSLLAYEQPAVIVRELSVTPGRARVGDTIDITFSLQSDAPQPQQLVVDYVIHFVKANGGMSAKVFKLRTLSLGHGEFVRLQKRHSLRPITTRRYYPGRHRVEVQVNGVILGGADFDLDTP
jgi:3-methyladenine DNA glycosylase AlkC